MMTYVLSDIHGNLRRFESIMKQIDLQPDDTYPQMVGEHIALFRMQFEEKEDAK